MSTIYCLLSTVFCLLSTDYCLLSTVYCLLSPVFFLLSTVYCLLSTVYCLLSTVYCLLSTTGVVHRLQAGLSLGGAHAREVCGNVQSGEEKYVKKNQKVRTSRSSREATRSSSAGTPSGLLIRTEAAPSTSQSSYWPCTSRPLVSRHATSSV